MAVKINHDSFPENFLNVYICTPIRAGAGKRASHPETIAEFCPRAEAALSFVDQTVKDQPFLVGDHCTIADIGC
jgi:glutathione S-transferase